MINRRASAPKIKVGIVQPNLAPDQKGVETPNLMSKQLADLQLRSAELEAAGADLIVWPENSYPFLISRRATSDRIEQYPGRIQRGFATPLLMGAETYDPTNRGGYTYNTALMLDRSGKFTAKFDKIFLVIFSEYIPGLETFPWIRKFLPKAAEHLAHGKDIVTFPYQTTDGREWRLGPMICYEDTLPSFGRKLAPMHPHLLVNITNDAWFGDTSEPWQHLALSVYRSVELRTELVRAVNTGVAAFDSSLPQLQV
jgi:apolipoprotein N-acyltransferase